MKNSSTKKFLSLDAGASTLRLVIFNESGETLGSMIKKPGANISINPEESTKKVISSISDVLEGASLSYEDISHYSLGIAGISDDKGREMLFKGLDEKKRKIQRETRDAREALTRENWEEQEKMAREYRRRMMRLEEEKEGKLANVENAARAKRDAMGNLGTMKSESPLFPSGLPCIRARTI